MPEKVRLPKQIGGAPAPERQVRANAPRVAVDPELFGQILKDGSYSGQVPLGAPVGVGTMVRVEEVAWQKAVTRKTALDWAWLPTGKAMDLVAVWLEPGGESWQRILYKVEDTHV